MSRFDDIPGGLEGVEKIVIEELRLPTEEIIRRYFLAHLECWLNTPCVELGRVEPWEVALDRSGRAEVEDLAWERFDDGLTPVDRLTELLPDLERSARSGPRYVEAYGRSGGLWNLFAEPATEHDDEQWQELAARQAAGELSPDEAARRWNGAQSLLFADLTPAQVWAGGGPEEAALLRDFAEWFTRVAEPEGYRTFGEMVKSSCMLLRQYQLAPSKAAGGRPAGRAVFEERARILAWKEGLLGRGR